jgi:hypothetical protein
MSSEVNLAMFRVLLWRQVFRPVEAALATNANLANTTVLPGAVADCEEVVLVKNVIKTRNAGDM